MDFRFSPEEEGFRSQVQNFLAQELPHDWVGYYLGEAHTDEEWAFSRMMTKKLADKGWLVIAWPEAWGGQHDQIKQLILMEEMYTHEVPGFDIVGVTMFGPILLQHGSEAQKKQHLPGIARGEVVWCQGFSEPEAGSDLASLRTTCTDHGDHWVINGQKLWTSNSHRANWIFILARTNPDLPKHRGISLVLADMKTPGITVRPLVNMGEMTAFSEVFLDNVRIPKENLVGQKDDGWNIANATLGFERSSIHRMGSAWSCINRLVRYVGEIEKGGGLSERDLLVRHKLADLAIQAEIGRLFAYRVAWMQRKGISPGHLPSVSRLFGAELQQHVAKVGMEVLGLYGQLGLGSYKSLLGGRIALEYLASVAATISAGTAEMQRNIIATRGLGMKDIK
jgi:alkylation response protein AidB-like acyl-CoA dehydrogenase